MLKGDSVARQWQKYNGEGREQWNRKAVFRDALHDDEGNSLQRHLIIPAVERLLAIDVPFQRKGRQC